MIGLLQSDIKSALKTAFANMDGPLSVVDWCRGRSNIAESAAMGDAYSFHYTTGDIRDTSNSIPIGGDAMSPPQSSNDRGIPVATSLNLSSTSLLLPLPNIILPEGESHDSS
jgi:mediator of RNA polymerase II transcription subunit 13